MRISDWSSDVCSSDLNAHDVRSGSREDPDDQCRLAALGGETAIVPRAKLDARDIAQPDDLAAAFSPQDDLLKFLGIGQATLRRDADRLVDDARHRRSEEHTSELQSLMRISYAVFCLKKKMKTQRIRL